MPVEWSEAAGEEEWVQPGLLTGNRFAALANDDAPQRLVPGESRWKAGKGKGMSKDCGWKTVHAAASWSVASVR